MNDITDKGTTTMRFLTLLSLITLLAASPAAAQIDIDMAFDPAEAAPGDFVTFTGSLVSMYQGNVEAEFELSASFKHYEIGPITTVLPVCGGQDLQLQLPIYIPHWMCGGDLTISLKVTSQGMSDTATAVLTIIDEVEAVAAAQEETDPTIALTGIGGEIIFSFSCNEVPISTDSFGALKTNW